MISFAATSIQHRIVRSGLSMNVLICSCFVSIGPFTDINSEEVEEEIGGMYRTVLKLTKTFGDAPGPRRVADSVKSKIDKFKVHIPLLQIICNPGLRERHWEQVKLTALLRIF